MYPDYKNAAALTTKSRHMIFVPKYFNKAIVRHELIHAYVYGLPIQSAYLNLGQFEEVICDLFGERYDQYSKKVTEMYNTLTPAVKKANKSSRINPPRRGGHTCYRTKDILCAYVKEEVKV